MERYSVYLEDGDEPVKKFSIDLEYIPEHFIFGGDVWIVREQSENQIWAVLSTPCAITLTSNQKK